MERADAIQAGDKSVTSSVIQGKFGIARANPDERVPSVVAQDSTAQLEDLSVPDETRRALLRSRVFGSIAVAGKEGATLHRGLLTIVGEHLAGRNPMVSTDGLRIYARFALASREPNNEKIVHRFAESVAVILGADPSAVEEARVMQFDTRDIDHLVLPEHRSE
jgi:hypothetical protein